MRIQELELRTGLERPTIRFYEKEGLITPKRRENGYREYSEEDIQQLQKIKLLRQLGMSVEKIRQLQQGTADFPAELDKQIRFLTDQIFQSKRAREVCQTMRNDGVNYSSLNAEHYLRLLQMAGEDPVPKSSFQEKLPEEIHPWRRFFARSLDYMLFSAIMQVLLFVVFRIRPIPGNVGSAVLGVLYCLLFIPMEALMTHFWGTTPGKMAMGIRMEYIDGGKLPLDSALRRAFHVCMLGCGFCIPFVELAVNIYCYCKLTGRATHRLQRYNEIDPPDEMTWDEETEIVYESHIGKAAAALVIILVAYGILTAATVNDMIKPHFRGDRLTVAQFAENYNQMLRFTHEDAESYDKLMSNGAKYAVPEGVYIISMGEGSNSRNEFGYETENDYLISISYENSWDDLFMVTPVNYACYNAALSLLMAQEGCGYQELEEFTELWQSYQNNANVSFHYQNLDVQWNVEYSNCMFYDGMLITQDDTAHATADIEFCLVIHNAQ